MYLADVGGRTLNVVWDAGPGDARFTAEYGQFADGPWFIDDPSEPLDTAPVEIDGEERVTGAGELIPDDADGDELPFTFVLPIPAEPTC